MRRRDVVTALAGLGLLAPGPARPANSRRGCFVGDDRLVRCSTGFPDLPPIPAQPCRHLAWATCLAYLLRGFGAVIGEADVRARAGYGSRNLCKASDAAARLAASAGQWRDREGRRFVVSVRPLPAFSDYAIKDPNFGDLLARLERQPLLCGAAGHTTVVAEIQTAGDRFGRMWRERVRVLDPYAPERGLRDLTEGELARRSYVFGVGLRAL